MEKFSARLAEAMQARKISQAALSKKTGISPSTISEYLKDRYEAKQGNIYLLAEALSVNPAWLMGLDVDMELYPNAPADIPDDPNVFVPKLKKVPLLGTTAAGEPVISDEDFEGYVPCTEDADFCLHVKGDSMIGIGINDGDIVFVKAQKEVENGQVAVVRINGDEVTLKRFYRTGDSIILASENPAVQPFILNAQNTDQLQIIGRAVIKQSKIL